MNVIWYHVCLHSGTSCLEYRPMMALGGGICAPSSTINRWYGCANFVRQIFPFLKCLIVEVRPEFAGYLIFANLACQTNDPSNRSPNSPLHSHEVIKMAVYLLSQLLLLFSVGATAQQSYSSPADLPSCATGFEYHGCAVVDLNGFSGPIYVPQSLLTHEICQTACQGSHIVAIFAEFVTSCTVPSVLTNHSQALAAVATILRPSNPPMPVSAITLVWGTQL